MGISAFLPIDDHASLLPCYLVASQGEFASSNFWLDTCHCATLLAIVVSLQLCHFASYLCTCRTLPTPSTVGSLCRDCTQQFLALCPLTRYVAFALLPFRSILGSVQLVAGYLLCCNLVFRLQCLLPLIALPAACSLVTCLLLVSVPAIVTAIPVQSDGGRCRCLE